MATKPAFCEATKPAFSVLDCLRPVSPGCYTAQKQPLPGTSQHTHFWEMYLDEIAARPPAAPAYHRRLASPPQPATAAPARPLGGRGRKRLRLLLRDGGGQACSLLPALTARAVRVPVAGPRRLPLRPPCALPPARVQRRDAGTGARSTPDRRPARRSCAVWADQRRCRGSVPSACSALRSLLGPACTAAARSTPRTYVVTVFKYTQALLHSG